MTGIHHIEVKNRDAIFRFDLVRNITVVRGNSGTGKTTLFDMIADYTRLKDKSGINLSCDKNCVALIDMDWKNQLETISDSIVFIDEGAQYVESVEFADAVKNSDNYYVIFSRVRMPALPYSVEEIYEIKTSGKYHSLKKIYKSDANHNYNKKKISPKIKFTVMVTEDSKSGFQFYENYFKNSELKCYSSESNSSIFKWLKDHPGQNVIVVADGAAFGSEIDRVLKLIGKDNCMLLLPESFEWLILKSGLIKNGKVNIMLENPSDYIESKDYFSWEKYFEKFLVAITVNTPFQYAKREIAGVYLNKVNSDVITDEIFSANTKQLITADDKQTTEKLS